MAKFNDNDVFTIIRTENIYEGEIDQELSPTSTNPVENKVITNEINKIKNGNTPVGKSLVTKQIENVSENSGSTQTDPFINQATGTKNNTTSTPVSPVAKQLEKRGNSVAYNQLAKTMSAGTTTKDGLTLTKYSDHFTIQGTATADGRFDNVQMIGDSKFIVGHKYLFIGLTNASNSTYMGYFYDVGYIRSAYAILTVSIQNANHTMQIDYVNGAVLNETIYLKAIDITQWFGGNDLIPQDILDNPSHFINYYNGDYHYSTGEMLDSDGVTLETIEFNQWDEEWELGSISNSDGSNTTSSSQIRSKNYIRVIPNTTYYFCYKGNNLIGKIVFYDVDKNLISITSHTKNTTFIVSSNVIYMRFVIGDTSIPITTYNHDICINLSWDGERDGEYQPYIKHTYDTGSEILRSAGSVKDIKLPSGVITRNVGTVDLGTLNWEKSLTSSNSYYFKASLSPLPKRASSSTTLANLICSIYENQAGLYVYQAIKDKVIGIPHDNDIVMIYDESKANLSPTEFKTAMSGVYLYYELKTPTTEQGTPFAENIEVDDYGIMGWLDGNGNYVAIPQGCKLFYPADLVLTLDDLNNLTDGDVSKLALKTDIPTIPTIPTVTDLSNDVTNITDLTPINIAVMNIDGFITISMLLSNSGNTILSNTTLFTLDSTDLAFLTYIHVLPAILFDGNGAGYNIMLNVDSSGNVTASQDIPIQTILTINFTY